MPKWPPSQISKIELYIFYIFTHCYTHTTSKEIIRQQICSLTNHLCSVFVLFNADFHRMEQILKCTVINIKFQAIQVFHLSTNKLACKVTHCYKCLQRGRRNLRKEFFRGRVKCSLRRTTNMANFVRQNLMLGRAWTLEIWRRECAMFQVRRIESEVGRWYRLIFHGRWFLRIMLSFATSQPLLQCFSKL